MTYAALNADQRGGTGASGKPSFTIEAAAAQLTRGGTSWSSGLGQPTVVTYAFRATAPTTMPSDTTGFQQFNVQQILAAEAALKLWGQVANIQFVRGGSGVSGSVSYSDDATILFGNYTSGEEGASGFAFMPGNRASTSSAGDVWLNVSLDYIRSPQGSAGFTVLMHEIGHAIGLSHPGEYDVSDIKPTYAANATYNEDSLEYSVMSYFSLTNTGGSVQANGQPITPLMDDIAAVQRLYGANNQAALGNTTYGANPYNGSQQGSVFSSNPGGPVYGTIWDSGGIDSIDFAYSNYAERIDLRAGSFSDVQGGVGTLSIAPGVIIENAIGGSANDVLSGNEVDNQLVGNDGDDVLTGRSGNDLLIGGNGLDRGVIQATYASVTLAVSDAGDIVVNSSDGRDTLRTIETINFTDRNLTVASVTNTDGLYRTYMGRGAAASEFSFWLGQLDTGHSLGEIRTAILNDSYGHAHTVSTIDSFYDTYMGRSAEGSELVFWEGHVKSGMEFGTVRYFIASDWSSRPYIDQQIAQSYRAYMGRSATAAEITFWHDQVVAGTTETQFHGVLARDFGSQQHLKHLIADAYAFGMSRDPIWQETDFWLGQLRTGLPISDMQRLIGSDSPVTGQSAGTVTAAYEMYMGRAPNAAELAYWDGQARTGGSLQTLREAILNDTFGHAHTVDFLNSIYQQYFNRAPGASEIDAWKQAFGQGTAFDTARATLILDGGNVDAHRYDAYPKDTVITLPNDIGFSIVSSFSNSPAKFGGSYDPYAGAAVPSFDVDVIDLRGSGFTGNPLDHAREITELSGMRDVLISYDADHEILIRGITLAQLSTDNFRFA